MDGEEHAVDDAKVLEVLRQALRTADMETSTGPLLITQQDYALTCVAERQLRKTIEAQLGVDLTERKALIRAEIEAYLAASLPAADQEEAEDDFSEQRPAKKQKRSGAGLGSVLSPAMQAFLGCETLPRPQVVRRIWEYIKEHQLQNPSNKRKIIVDERLATLFTPPIDMFSMNKQLSKHVFAADTHAGESTNNAAPRPAVKAKATIEVKDEQGAKPDSGAAGSEEGGGKKRKANGFTKQIMVSDELSKFLGGKATISRPELTSAFWDYVKRNNLQDESNKKYVISDAALKRLTGQDRFQGFGFAKLFNKHLYPDSGRHERLITVYGLAV